MRRAALLALTAASLHSLGNADLIWDNKELEAASPPVGTERAVTFAYQNPGLTPVHIDSVQVSCGCLATQLSKTRVAHGERGILTARLRTVGVSLPRLVRIEIRTAEDPLHPTRLQIRLRPPTTLEPAFLLWESAKDPGKKTAQLTIPEGWSARLGSTAKTLPFVSSLERETLSSVWTIRIAPIPGAHAGDYELPIECQAGTSGTAAETRSLFLRITQEPSPQGSASDSPQRLGP